MSYNMGHITIIYIILIIFNRDGSDKHNHQLRNHGGGNEVWTLSPW